MGDEDHRGRPALPDPQQLELEDLPRLRVDRRERLVHQQDLRLRREGPGEPRPLLHAAGELIRIRLLEAGEPDELDVLRDRSADVLPRRPGEPEPVRDVLVHRLPREEAEVLEDDRDAAGRRRHRGAVDPHLARGRQHQPVDAAQQRRLAAAARPDDRHDLALADRHVDVLEDAQRAEALRETLDLDPRAAGPALLADPRRSGLHACLHRPGHLRYQGRSRRVARLAAALIATPSSASASTATIASFWWNDRELNRM